MFSKRNKKGICADKFVKERNIWEAREEE